MRRLVIPALLTLPLAVFLLRSDLPDRPRSTAVDQPGSVRPRGGEEAQNWELSRQNYPQGVELPPAINQAVLDWQAQMPDESQYEPPNGQSLRRVALAPWEFVGPAGAPVRGTSSRYTGRVRDLEYRESSGLRVGSASGGLWEYRDGTPFCLTDNLVPYAGAFATHPGNDDHIVLGTGEPGKFTGIGIWYTTNRGSSWNESLGVEAVTFHDVVFTQWTNRQVHAAGSDGHYVSVDDGVSFVRTRIGLCTSIAVDQTTPGVLYAAFSGEGIYKSINSGTTWSPLSTPELTPALLRRATVTLSPSDPDQVWVFAATQEAGEEKPLNDVLLLSTDAGTTWEEVDLPSGFAELQADYNQLISVHPTDSDIVILGGVQLWRSEDGGASWTQSSGVHADNHRVEWSDDGAQLWNGSDGGVFHSTDAGKTFSSAANDLPITQYWTVSVCPEDPEIMIGGTQDNGVPATNGISGWEIVAGGDGGGALIVPGACYESLMGTGVFSGDKAWKRARSYDFFATFSEIEDGIDANGSWYPRIRTALGQDRVYTHAERNVYYLQGPSIRWSKLSPTPLPANVLDLGVEPAFSGGVWATHDTDVLGQRVHYHQGGTWSARDGGGMGPGLVRKIVAHPYITGAAYAILTNVGDHGDNVYRTSDRGLTWTAISTGVRDLVANDIAVHPLDPNELWLSTTTGVQWSPNGGFSWYSWNAGLPDNLLVREMSLVPTGEVPREYWIVAATYGRGVWRRHVSGPAVAGPPVVANSSFNLLPDRDLRVNPGGNGQTLAEVDATVTVQISDAAYLPVPGIAASRITLYGLTGAGLVWCGGEAIADGPTDALGMTTFSLGLAAGSRTTYIGVRLDGVPILRFDGIAELMPLDIRSTDISGDLSVDLVDYVHFADDMQLFQDEGYYSSGADLDFDNQIDLVDEAWLGGALNDPAASCAVPPAMEAPYGTIGVYFDAAGTESARIIAPGQTFPLYVIAKGLALAPRAFEFAIPALLDPAIELGTQMSTYPMTLVDHRAAPANFRFVGSGTASADQILFYYPAVRLKSPVEGLTFRVKPAAKSSFGSSLTPGWVPEVEPFASPLRVPFAAVELAVVNPFPGDLWAGFVVDKLGEAGINIVAERLDLSFLGPGLSGAGIGLAGFGIPGALRGSGQGVDGAAFAFVSSLPAANLPEGASLGVDFVAASGESVVAVEGVVESGNWVYGVDMSALGSVTGRLQLRGDEQVLLDRSGFAGTWSMADGLPDRIAVGRLNAEIVIFQGWDTPTPITVDGQNYNADTVLFFSESGGSDPAALFHGAHIVGTQLPTVSLERPAVQRFGNFFSALGNLWFRNQPDRLEATLQEWQSPARVGIESVDASPVRLEFAGPVLADEPDAEVELRFRDGPGDLVITLRNGAPVTLGTDLSGLGSPGWTVLGYEGLEQTWEFAGDLATIGGLERWPVETRMIASGVRMEFDVPTEVDPAQGALQRRSLAPVTAIEIVPLQPVSGLPSGARVEIGFGAMRTLAFLDGSFGVSAPPAKPVLATRLHPARPNPFNPRTELRFELDQPDRVKLTVYDVRGRRVRTLLDGERSAGSWSEVWDGADQSGRRVASGVYQVRFQTSAGEHVQKVTLVK